jgi:hypothetical protein
MAQVAEARVHSLYGLCGVSLWGRWHQESYTFEYFGFPSQYLSTSAPEFIFHCPYIIQAVDSVIK